jgi:hypothetical protein
MKKAKLPEDMQKTYWQLIEQRMQQLGLAI